MRPKYITLTPADANLTGFASNVTGDTWTLTATSSGDSLAHQVSIRNDSATDHSGKNAVLTGTDANGHTITETVTLPTGSATVESSSYFLTLTSVVPSATIGADAMDIGWVDEFISQTVPLDHYVDEVAVEVEVVSGSTINYTLQQTFDNIQDLANVTSIAYRDSDDAAVVDATRS